jgi:hypothetical protein
LGSGAPGSLVGTDAMRPHLPRPVTAQHSATMRGNGERSSQGCGWAPPPPSCALLERSEAVSQQPASVTAVQAAGIVFVLGDGTFGWALIMAAAMLRS